MLKKKFVCLLRIPRWWIPSKCIIWYGKLCYIIDLYSLILLYIITNMRVTTIQFPSNAQVHELADGAVVADILSQANFWDNVQLEHNGRVLQVNDTLTNGMVIKVVETDNTGRQVVKKIAGANDYDDEEDLEDEEVSNDPTPIEWLIIVSYETKVVVTNGKRKAQVEADTTVASFLSDAWVSMRWVRVLVNGEQVQTLGTKLNDWDNIEIITN